MIPSQKWTWKWTPRSEHGSGPPGSEHRSGPPEVNMEVAPRTEHGSIPPRSEHRSGTPRSEHGSGPPEVNMEVDPPPLEVNMEVDPSNRPHIGHTSSDKRAVFLWEKDFYLLFRTFETKHKTQSTAFSFVCLPALLSFENVKLDSVRNCIFLNLCHWYVKNPRVTFCNVAMYFKIQTYL